LIVVVEVSVPVTPMEYVIDVLLLYEFVPVNTAFTLCSPTLSVPRKLAVPPVVTQALPSRCSSSQYLALASQKFTRPDVTGDPPEVTVAVSVRTVPAETVSEGDMLKAVEVVFAAQELEYEIIRKSSSAITTDDCLFVTVSPIARMISMPFGPLWGTAARNSTATVRR